jgi:hypothetical protein
MHSGRYQNKFVRSVPAVLKLKLFNLDFGLRQKYLSKGSVQESSCLGTNQGLSNHTMHNLAILVWPECPFKKSV